MSFTVGQLSKLTGLTVRALHHYDAIGLLVPSQRSDSGYRLYTQSDIVKLYRIQALKRLGLSLLEIETALAREGATLPETISQQLAALDNQIEQATALRLRLRQLRDVLAHGDEPGTGEWLSAVELIAQYDKHFSPEEVNRLIDNNNDQPEWQTLFADLRMAMEDGIDPRCEQAQTLMKRWSSLMMRRVGGDVSLMVKMKLAYAKDPDIRARLEIGGMSPKLGEYLVQIMTHAHLELWSRHLTTEEIQRLRPQGAWQEQLLHVVGALRQEMSVGAASDSASVQVAIRDWDSLVDTFVAGDSMLRGKVLDALRSDADLRFNWILDTELQNFLQRVHGAV